jgi:hypothetical protein
MLTIFFCVSLQAATPEALFREATEAYAAGEFTRAAKAFGHSARLQPASGTLQNLGNAQWKSGRNGSAILAWEQALWIDSFNKSARGNLLFARKSAQLETPDLRWYEVISAWLPYNWWAWSAGASLWIALAAITLPAIFGWRKTVFQQAIAAVALMIFLLTIPAHFGIYTRSHVGFVLQADTPLTLTPTSEGQLITRLPAGQPARYERRKGQYLLIRAGSQGFRGWIEAKRLGLIAAEAQQ